MKPDLYHTLTTLQAGKNTYRYFQLDKLPGGDAALRRLPFTIRILLEDVLRHTDGVRVTQADVEEHRDDCEASGSSPASIRRRLAALSSFFDYAQSGEEAGDNPAAKVERPKSPDASTTAVRAMANALVPRRVTRAP